MYGRIEGKRGREERRDGEKKREGDRERRPECVGGREARIRERREYDGDRL